MLKQGAVEPSASPWASPIVLVQKKDDSVCFCVNYCKLNQVTKLVEFPLLRIDDTLDILNGSRDLPEEYCFKVYYWGKAYQAQFSNDAGAHI